MMAFNLPNAINQALGQENGDHYPPQFEPPFRAHFAQFPNDTNFLYDANEHVITCIEDACMEDVGDFSSFQNHIRSSEAHRKSRDQRVTMIRKDSANHHSNQPTPSGSSSTSGPRTASQVNNATSNAAAGGSFKRSSSPLQLMGSSAKKAKSMKPQPKPTPVLADRVNKPVARVPTAVARQFPPQAQVPRVPAPAPRLPAPASAPAAAAAAAPVLSQAEQVATYKQLVNVKHSLSNSLVALRTYNMHEPDFYNQYDAIQRKTQLAENQYNQFVARYGVPVGATHPGLASAMDRARAKNPMPNVHAHAPVASGSGLRGGLAGLADMMMNVVNGAQAYDSEDEYEDWDEDHPFAKHAHSLEMGRTLAGEDFLSFIQGASEGRDFEGNETVDQAMEKITNLNKETRTVEGMVVKLMPHQIIGVAWMQEKEESRQYGGILGDEMGLGKTVQAIACMANNESQDPDEKTTLIVAPLALLRQWKEEIETKLEANHWRVLIHHGPTRARHAKELMKYDVVLTTYHTLASEWPDEETAFKKKKKRDQEDSDDEFEIKIQAAGPLFKANFFRVILDEAQNIRNRQTKISRAVMHVDSLYRWCLTGTPIMNSLSDIFPYLRFLQIKPWYEWKAFRDHIAGIEKKQPDLAGLRAQAILARHVMRRKKTTKLDGKPLVELPEKHIELQVLEFTPEEREIYTFVETQSQQVFNKYLRAGTVLKNYANVLVMLLRLRQLCLHPSLIASGSEDLEQAVEDSKAREVDVERAKRVLGGANVARLKKKLLDRTVLRMKAEKRGEEVDDEDGDCPICMEPTEDGEGGVVTKCAHIFCRPCIMDVLAGPAVDRDDGDDRAINYKADERPCPTCRQPISQTNLFRLKSFEPTDEELGQFVELRDEDIGSEDSEDEFDSDDEMGDIDDLFAKKNGQKGKGKKVNLKGKGKATDEDDEEIEVAGPRQRNRAVVMDSDDEEEEKEIDKAITAKSKVKELPPWLTAQEPSTKFIWLGKEILRARQENSDDKFLVLSQFTSALDMVEEYLKKLNIIVTRYQGDMNVAQRDESVSVLKKSKKCFVMLMSLKCGGVGLNLTRANRVVNLDLAWSHAVEAQAFDRCHRIGQDKEVFVNRLTIANTVEQRVGELQERKKLLADTSLGEGGGKKIGKLTVSDLANLFGLDMRGNRI